MSASSVTTWDKKGEAPKFPEPGRHFGKGEEKPKFPEPGRNLGDTEYFLAELLAVSETAAVYRATDRAGATVAVKVFRDDETAGCFWNELNADREMRERPLHPHILHCLWSGKAESFPYVVTPYCPYGTLQDFLKRHPDGIEPKVVIEILKQIARALVYAHERGVLHTDLKLANVLVKRERTPVHVLVCDFGLANVKDAPEKPGYFRGTYYCAAPEQVDGEKPSRAWDSWAFGFLAHELITGQRPLQIITSRRPWRRIRQASYRYLDMAAPPKLAKLVKRLLNDNPKARPSMRTTLKELNGLE